MTDYSNGVNLRRVQWEDPFHTDAERDAPDGECLRHPAAITPDADPLKVLDAFLVAFDDFHGDAQGVARAKIRNGPFHVIAFEFLEQPMHESSLPRVSDTQNLTLYQPAPAQANEKKTHRRIFPRPSVEPLPDKFRP